MLFRRVRDTDLWHWRPQCRQWPTENSEERAGLPRGGFLCPECEALDLRSALQRLTEEEEAEMRAHQRATSRQVVRRRQGGSKH